MPNIPLVFSTLHLFSIIIFAPQANTSTNVINVQQDYDAFPLNTFKNE
jgi:hypothetical protein